MCLIFCSNVSPRQAEPPRHSRRLPFLQVGDKFLHYDSGGASLRGAGPAQSIILLGVRGPPISRPICAINSLYFCQPPPSSPLCSPLFCLPLQAYSFANLIISTTSPLEPSAGIGTGPLQEQSTRQRSSFDYPRHFSVNGNKKGAPQFTLRISYPPSPVSPSSSFQSLSNQ